MTCSKAIDLIIHGKYKRCLGQCTISHAHNVGTLKNTNTGSGYWTCVCNEPKWGYNTPEIDKRLRCTSCLVLVCDLYFTCQWNADIKYQVLMFVDRCGYSQVLIECLHQLSERHMVCNASAIIQCCLLPQV